MVRPEHMLNLLRPRYSWAQSPRGITERLFGIIIVMNEGEQRALIRQAAGGDPDALQTLIVCHHGTLRVRLEREIEPGARRYVEPDDVLQDAYAAAFKSIAGCRFDDPPQFYRWLERIVLNGLKNRWRDLRRQKRDIAREVHGSVAPRASYPALLERVTAHDGTPSRLAARSEAVAAMLSSLARLTDDQRDVVRLRFLEEMPVAEVADRLGKTDAAIHSLSMRALRALQQHLGAVSDFLTRS